MKEYYKEILEEYKMITEINPWLLLVTAFLLYVGLNYLQDKKIIN